MTFNSHQIQKSHIPRSQSRSQLGKMSFHVVILISVLCFAAYSEAKWELQNNVYIIDSGWTSNSSSEEVHLHCNVSGKHNASVYWKKDDTLLDKRDASWKIKVKEPPSAGNFTCWSRETNELLNYATLYVAKINQEGRIRHQILKSEGSSNSSFKCTANNYSGSFTCSWMIDYESLNQNLKFAVRSLNNENTSGRVTCEEPIRDSDILRRYSVSCKQEKPCLSTEEYQQIEIGLDVFDEHIYENDTLRFFLKDIIKPDVTACEIRRGERSRHYQFTWNPPQTWSTPISYYGLTYQLKTVERTIEKICEIDNPVQLGNGHRLACSIIIPRNVTCYIRSRDLYNKNSAWSEWSNPCSAESQKTGQNHHTHDSRIKIAPCNCQKKRS